MNVPRGRVMIAGVPPPGLAEALAGAGVDVTAIEPPGGGATTGPEATAAALRGAEATFAGPPAAPILCLLCDPGEAGLTAAITAIKAGARLAILGDLAPGADPPATRRIVTALGAKRIDPSLAPPEAAAALLDLLR